jgi:hypothetical protein
MNHLRNKIPICKIPIRKIPISKIPISKIPILKIKIDGFPIKKKTDWSKTISFCTGTMLCISESLPFIDNEYNGILHMLSKIKQEYKDNFN